MVDLLKRPPVKSLIIAILTIATSVLLALLGSWNHDQPYFLFKITLFFMTVLTYLGALIFYTTHEVNDRRTIEILKNQVNSFEDLLTNIISICQQNASDINVCIKSIKESQQFDMNVWSFNKCCQGICRHIYQNICKIGGSKEFGISYVKLVEDDTHLNCVQMIAYANKNMSKPSIYNEIRCFNNSENNDMYHDLELFFNNSADVDIIIGQDQIDDAFTHKTKETRKKNKGKYNQYIAIPVFCDNRKMIGLLEVVCFQQAKLGITREELEEVANKILVPYAHILLIMHKIEKALTAGTSVVL